jgi:dihydrofolate reductase
MSPRPVVYHIASSLDGFIADEADGFALFPPSGAHVDDYVASFAEYGVCLMGRRTYDIGRAVGVTSPYPMMQQIVFSRTLATSPDPAVELVRSDPAARVRALKAEAGKPIYLCGGGELAKQLFEAGLVDELLLKLNPILLGRGKPLFGAGVRSDRLRFVDQKTYPSGVLRLRYQVTGASAASAES